MRRANAGSLPGIYPEVYRRGLIEAVDYIDGATSLG
jgi:hypothetical protein